MAIPNGTPAKARTSFVVDHKPAVSSATVTAVGNAASATINRTRVDVIVDTREG